MAYATTNPPRCLVPAVGANEASLWMYVSADDKATVIGAGYFTDGDDLGFKVGDVVIIADTGTPLSSTAIVDAVAAGGAAELT